VEGRIGLDDDIREHVPELPDFGTPVTIRQLVHHTSGVRDYLTLFSLAGARDEDFYTDDEVVAMLARQRALNFPPGSEHLYSNSGYFLLSVIVRRVTGGSLAAYAQEKIFGPLGMTETSFWLAPEKRDRLARLYRLDPGGLKDVSFPHADAPEPFEAGGGGLISKADDYLAGGDDHHDKREDLRLGTIQLPDDPELFCELTMIRWEPKNGVVWVESKLEAKKRLGRSPDKADAAVYWNWIRPRAITTPEPDEYRQGQAMPWDYKKNRQTERPDMEVEVSRMLQRTAPMSPTAGRHHIPRKS